MSNCCFTLKCREIISVKCVYLFSCYPSRVNVGKSAGICVSQRSTDGRSLTTALKGHAHPPRLIKQPLVYEM